MHDDDDDDKKADHIIDYFSPTYRVPSGTSRAKSECVYSAKISMTVTRLVARSRKDRTMPKCTCVWCNVCVRMYFYMCFVALCAVLLCVSVAGFCGRGKSAMRAITLQYNTVTAAGLHCPVLLARPPQHSCPAPCRGPRHQGLNLTSDVP